MDTSETYIKQCEQAKRLQDSWKPQLGDLVATNTTLCVRVVYDNRERNLHYLRPLGFNRGREANSIVVFRQDQLQEMVFIKEGSLEAWITGFYNFTRQTIDYKVAVKDISMEQLWLAFVMEEKYNRVWNGETWVKKI